MDFRDLLSPSTKRHLQLVEAIYYSPDGAASSDQLLGVLACSMTSLLKDVKSINERQSNLQVIKYKGLYRLKAADHANIRSLYGDILSSSFEYKLIEELLYEESHGIVTMAERVFTSSSNVQRYLKRIEKVFKKTGIRLCYRPLRLEGDEMLIREFYHSYFIEKESGFEIRFPKLTQEQLLTVSKMIMNFLEVNEYRDRYLFQKDAVFRTIISLWRIKNGHSFPQSELRTNCLKSPTLEGLTAFKEMVTKVFSLEVTDDVFRDINWRSFSDACVLNYTHQTQAIAENRKYGEMFEGHRFLVGQFNELMAHALNPSMIDEIARILTVYFYPFYKKKELIIDLRNPRKRFIEGLSKDYTSTTVKVFSLVQQFIEAYSFVPKEAVDYYVYLLVTLVKDSSDIIELQNRKLHFLFIGDVMRLEEQHLVEYIRQSCHGNFELHQFEYRNHDDFDFWQEIKKYDGLITTCLVKNVPDSFPVAVIDALLPAQIIHKVQDLIETCLSDQK
ncbi:helix-turn-helix domain-containing protein [Enterococcus devriesei]|uniref:helix-turn-helix domain-containing protein n=1 Tax=Enterococcus devriesei TaxID=319970 RepID=UPI0036D24AA2